LSACCRNIIGRLMRGSLQAEIGVWRPALDKMAPRERDGR
jgi:hypothetical protein